MVGQTILHYHILEELGRGGMGVVYKAEDIKLKRLVALKFLPSHVTSSSDELARFNQEAQAAALLNHPNICTIYAIEEGIDPKGDKQQFIAMEYIDGSNLSRKIERSPLKTNDAISYAIQIGDALHEAHSNGIVHRDIKSENIMVNTKNQIKVMDFGLAKLKGSIKLTKTSSTVGTLAYMAPEQIQGSEIDARSDIFSFGVVLFEMLTGILPFRGEHDASMMYSIVNEDPEPLQKYLPDANSDLIHILNRTLEKDPEDRYQSMKDIVIELKRIRKKTGSISKKILYESAAQPRETTAQEFSKTESYTNGEASSEKIPAHEAAKSSNNKVKIIIRTAAAVVIVLAGLGYFLLSGKSSTTIIGKSIAVLPFKNLGSANNDEYFSDGITEDLTAELSQIGDLKVIARNAAMKYKNSDASIKDIGNELGVSSLLEGSVQKEGNEVRIVAQLIDVNTGEYIWAGTYDKELTQIFTIQSDVSKQIANALKAKLTPAEESRMEKKPTDNITAYQYYLKGREYYYRYTKEDNENAINLFKEALDLDPNYALAYAGLGDCYGQRTLRFGFPEFWNDSSIAVSEKAISIDPNLAEGYKALALAQTNKGWIKKSLATNKKAAELNPNYWPAVGNIGIDYMFMGEPAEGMIWAKKANVLDPESGLGYALTGFVYIILADYPNVEKNLTKALSIQPDLADVFLNYSIMHFDQGNFTQAIKDCEKVLTIAPNNDRTLIYMAISQIRLKNYDKAVNALQKITSNSQYKIYGNIYLAYCYKKRNNMEKSKKLIWLSKEELQKRVSGGSELYFDPYYMFASNVVEDSTGKAFKWLNKAVEFGLRDYNQVMNDPITLGIGNDPRFISIITNIKDKVEEQRNILLSRGDN